MDRLIETENQLSLFEQEQTEEGRPEHDSPDSRKPGAFWNGKIWVSDEDLPF